jgi:hypothetical protein
VDAVPATSRRVLGIGVAWMTLWLGFWMIMLGIIAGLDPDSIDPGEGALGMAANTLMALLFTAFGGLVTTVWLAIARSRGRRSALPSSS